MTITVMNLATEQQITYGCSPQEAVIAAHAQEQNDWNTWDYAKRYGHLVQWGKHTVLCGDWSAFWCECHTLEKDRELAQKISASLKGNPRKISVSSEEQNV